MKTQFITYADRESQQEKIQTCDYNPKKSFT